MTLAVSQEKHDLRVGFDVPMHLFVAQTGDSLCGRSRDRGDLTADETRRYTKPLSYPLKWLRNAEQTSDFADGMCTQCLRVFYQKYRDAGDVTVLGLFEDDVGTTEGRGVTLGFCYDCGRPVDPQFCASGDIGGEYHSYMCNICNDRFFNTLAENLGGSSALSPVASVGDGSEKRIEKLEQGRWDPYHREDKKTRFGTLDLIND